MSRPPTQRDRAEFKRYLAVLTDRQVRNVYHKETKANRKVYAELARYELFNRLGDIDLVDLMKGEEEL